MKGEPVRPIQTIEQENFNPKEKEHNKTHSTLKRAIVYGPKFYIEIKDTATR